MDKHTFTLLPLCEGFVKYSVSTVDTRHQYNSVNAAGGDSQQLTVQVLNVNGTTVSTGSTASGTLVINNVELWWPYTMNKRSCSTSVPAYLYTLQVTAYLYSLHHSLTMTIVIVIIIMKFLLRLLQERQAAGA